MSAFKREVAIFVILGGYVVAEQNVTVRLDATYAVDESRGPSCGGVGDLPVGTACPLKGDVAIADCNSNLSTYNGTDCVAPVNAECAIDAESKWRCIFPDSLHAEDEDLTSTLTISSGDLLEESLWGDLPWRAPPRLDSAVAGDNTDRFKIDNQAQVM